MAKISDYDEFDYNYENYWKNRSYEDKAEKHVLKKYLKGFKGKFFLDIGGSFGRNLSIYSSTNETPIILDYSFKTLQKNQKRIFSQCSRTQLVAANAYYMPFKKNSIDGSLMVRVLHHIENQKKLFTEIDRVTKNQGLFILEYANKLHLKAKIKWLLELNFKNFSIEPYQQPTQGNFEGARDGKEAIFLNYHPKYIAKLLSESNFYIKEKTNCSFFRVNFLKRTLPSNILMALEKISQKLFSWTNITPSIVIKTLKESKKTNPIFKNFNDILCCPKCKEDLRITQQRAHCKNCKKIFKQKNNIWDFRI